MMATRGDSSAAPAVRALPTPAGERFDRVPPHNLDAEVSVLGSMLLSKDAIADISELLGPDDFYRGAHRTIFEAARNLYDRGEPVDPVTLADELEQRSRLEDVGGVVAIDDIVRRVPTAANALYYGRIVAEQALRRRLIDAGTEITRYGYEPEAGVDEAVDSAERLIFNVAQRGHRSEFTSMKELLNASFEMIEKLHEDNSAITGLPTGLIDFDELTAGLQPSNLVILAARPAMGKCLGFSNLVIDPTTGALVPIGVVVETGGTQRPSDVAAIGRDFKLHPATPSAYLDNGVKPVFRLRTRLGRELVATANHPLLTCDGWLPLGMLRRGERVATPRALPYFGHRRLAGAEVELLAYVTGDGGLTTASPRCTTTNPRLPAGITEGASVFGLQARRAPPEHRLHGDGDANPLTALLLELGLMGKGSGDRFVPEPIFTAPREQVALFLNRLFASDGRVCVDDASAQVTYTSNSETLVRQVQHLLLRFGIIARLRQLAVLEGSGKRAFQLQITGSESIRTLAAEIGILGQEQRLAQALELLAEIASASTDESMENKSTSDVYWDEVVSIEPVGEERVFDLAVPGDHNFVAGDVIVHNSTLVTNIATHVAVEQRQTAVLFSLEMSQMELVQRVLASEARVDSERLRTGRLQESDWPKLSQAMGRLAEAPLFIDDTPGINMMEIRSKSRRLKQKHGLSLIIVDYLQLMQSHRRVENRAQEVAELSRGLKILAKELDIPVIALSQLNRKPEERTDKRPQLADLRESGSVEQDADLVCFIYRDEVYDPDSAAKGEAELIVAKHRNGPLKTVRLSFIGHHSRFASMARGPIGGGGPL